MFGFFQAFRGFCLKDNEVISWIEGGKNTYSSEFSGNTKEIRVPGKIKIIGSLKYSNDDELLKNLNSLEDKVQDGMLEHDTVQYKVKVVQGLYQGMDLDNICLVFSWDGYSYQGNTKTDLAI